jgi:hypothetical protein
MYPNKGGEVRMSLGRFLYIFNLNHLLIFCSQG